ncbi:MAG: HDOD domain-containing protein [Gammaproteobacteria bacterium]|nr:MAG: HDOD domain-containing protein [Gammaproteobacteria bacterium]
MPPGTKEAQTREVEPSVEALHEDVLRLFRAGRLRIPSLPDVALRVRAAVNDPQRGVADVARIVQVDAALAARLVHIANSPLYRGACTIDNCHMAVSRLGLEATRNFVVAFTLRNLFRPRHRTLLPVLQEVWRLGCRTAAISAVLARVTPGVDADRVVLAALVQGIGALPVVDYLDRRAWPDPEAAERLIERLQGRLGRDILSGWGFDAELAALPEAIARLETVPPDTVPGEAPRCADVVQVAWVHARFGTARGYDGPPLPELASYRRLPISRLGPDASLEVLEQSREEIRELLQILAG